MKIRRIDRAAATTSAPSKRLIALSNAELRGVVGGLECPGEDEPQNTPRPHGGYVHSDSGISGDTFSGLRPK